MKKLNGVVIGAGYFSHFHLDAWQRIPEVKITAIMDYSVTKAKVKADQFGIEKVYGDLKEMLDTENPDFVDIITPPDSHHELIELLSGLGIPMICQKPVAHTFDEVLAIHTLLQKSEVPFMVHENWRFQPWYREIKSLLESSLIGEKIFQIGFKLRLGDGWGPDAYLDRQPYFRDMPRLFIHETGVHFVDTFRFLLGEISGVYAEMQTLNPLIQGEDKAVVLFDFEIGTKGILDANRYNESLQSNPRFTFGELWLEGENGSIFLNYEGEIVVKLLGKKPYTHHFIPSQAGFAGDSVLNCQTHFIQNLLQQKIFETNLTDYIKTLRIVEAIYKSHQESKKIILGKVYQD